MMPRKSVIHQLIVLLTVYAMLGTGPAFSGGAAEKLVNERLQTENLINTAGSTPRKLTASKSASSKGNKYSSATVWIPKESWQIWQECNSINCVLDYMKKSGASEEAIKFSREINDKLFGVTGYLEKFEEKGLIDLGFVMLPGRANTNGAYVLLNGSPPLISTELDPEYEPDITRDPNYPSLKKQYPNLIFWTAQASFISAQAKADGGQRFIFSYNLLNGGHAGEVLGTGEVAFDFDRNGVFKGTKLLKLVVPNEKTNSTEQQINIDNNKALGTKPFPVIFIHGIGSSAEATWGLFRDYLINKDSWIFGGVPRYHKDTKSIDISCPIKECTGGYGDFYTVDSPDNQLFSFDVQGAELSAIIQRVLKENPDKRKVVLVAHSMGGLVAREYIQGLAREFNTTPWIKYRDDVDKLITIGTPHQGSALPFICTDTSMCIELKLNPYASSLTELKINSTALQVLNNLSSHPLPDSVSYVSLIGTGVTNDFVFNENGDGIVTAISQNLGALVPPPKNHNSRNIPIKFRASPNCGHNLPTPTITNPTNKFQETHTCEAGDPAVWAVILRDLVEDSGKESADKYLTTNSKLELDGIEPIRVGMTVSESSKVIELTGYGNGVASNECSYVKPKNGPSGIDFMVTNNQIARIDINSKEFTTAEGARIGSTEAEILKYYPGNIEVKPHQYIENGHYLIFRSPDARYQNYRLIFETDGTHVTTFRAGKIPEVGWVERCG